MPLNAYACPPTSTRYVADDTGNANALGLVSSTVTAKAAPSAVCPVSVAPVTCADGAATFGTRGTEQPTAARASSSRKGRAMGGSLGHGVRTGHGG